VGTAYAINPDATVHAHRLAEVLGTESTSAPGFKLLGRVRQYEQDRSDLLSRLIRFAGKEVFLNLILVRKALLSEKDTRSCIEPFLSEIDLAQTAIPCAVTAVDLISGSRVVLKQGPAIQAVMASCAVPGFMPPIALNDMLLVDGGVIDTVPSGPAKENGNGPVIGVDVGGLLSQQPIIGDGVDAINRTAEIMEYHLSRPGRELADILIEPDVKHLHWTDFLNYEELIERGQQAAASKLDEIHRALKRARRKKILAWPSKRRPKK
jgi:NTE family protein